MNMNKQSLIAIFAVSLLLITASSAMIVGGAETDGATGYDGNQTPEFKFDDYVKTSLGSVDTYIMEKTVEPEVLFGSAVPEGCESTITVNAVLVLNNDLKTIGFEILVVSGDRIILSFNDTISEEGIDEENAWIYDGMTPKIMPMNFVNDIQRSWSLIQELQDLLPKVSSNIIKEKIEKMLAKAVVKKIALAAASAVIPGIGWAIAAINVGLAAYDLLKLLDELPGLVELAKIDVAGCIYDPENNTVKIAERYGGNNDGKAISLTSIRNSDPSKKTDGQFYIAYVNTDNHMVYVSGHVIEMQYAMAIMNIPNEDKLGDAGKGLSVYTPKESDAKNMVSSASGGIPIKHDQLGNGLEIGLKHYHHPLHTGNGNYPAHAFYGAPIER